MKRIGLLVFLLTLGAGTALAQDPAPTVAAPWDPTTTDPSPVDPSAPPSMRGISIRSGGTRLAGRLYLADGPGPHATVIFLRDVPGYGANEDLAQAVRRAGYNALLVDYRGTWGSGGRFGWSGTVEDAIAAIDFVASEEAVEEYRTDPERIHLVGEGFGSWTALTAAGARPGTGCIATLAAWNPAAVARELVGGSPAGNEWTEMLTAAANPEGGPLRAADPEALLRELMEDGAEFDLLRAVEGGRERSVLLLTSAIGEREPPRQTMLVAAALAGGGAESVDRMIINDDDAFSASRIRVARALVSWLETHCPAW